MFCFDPIERSPEALAMRAEVRDFIKEHRHLVGVTKSAFNPDFSSAMGKRGSSTNVEFDRLLPALSSRNGAAA